MKKLISIIVASVLLVGLGGYYLVKEADAAEPGDLLYPVDLASESVQRFFTFDEVASAELEEDILDERIDELNNLASEETIDEDLVLEATENVKEQQLRTQDRLETEDGELNGELEQARERYEQQVEEHLAVMEQVQEKAQGEETQNKIQEAVQSYEDSLTTVDTTEDSDTSNSTSNGNSDNSTSKGNK